MLVNYHTHTKRCHHAGGEDREYVEAAIEAGYQVLGFADHCPWIFPDGYVSGIRLAPTEVDGYFYSLESLKKEYASDIKIYIGFEAEYSPSMMESQEKLLSGYPLDYMILGQHFLGLEAERIYMGRETEDESRLQRYVDTVLEGIKTGKYLYVAHPDLIHYVGSKEVYRREMRRLCEGIKAAGMPIEINLLGLAENRHYPNRDFLEIAKEIGNSAILGVDAHAPEQFLRNGAREKGKDLVREFGLPLLETDLIL